MDKSMKYVQMCRVQPIQQFIKTPEDGDYFWFDEKIGVKAIGFDVMDIGSQRTVYNIDDTMVFAVQEPITAQWCLDPDSLPLTPAFTELRFSLKRFKGAVWCPKIEDWLEILGCCPKEVVDNIEKNIVYFSRYDTYHKQLCALYMNGIQDLYWYDDRWMTKKDYKRRLGL